MSTSNKTKLLNPKDFPRLLKEINDPPKYLNMLGELPEGNPKFLCVVGSRKFTPYGLSVCENLISGLAGQDIIIVSGLALGIDTIAHKSAIRSGLKTMALPGSSLEDTFIYPPSNFKLSKEIVEKGGCILSEFPPQTPGYPANFPQRNRIMAGLSHAVLVIEASIKSGTMITAKLATHYNREVLAVPGSIFSDKSDGPNALIRLGATPITSSKDILEALGLKESEEQTLFNPNKYYNCTPNELKIVELLRSPLSKDDLTVKCRDFASVSEINILISMLELKGLIKEFLGEIHLA